MAEAYYEPTPATDGATMNPVPGAVFEVYEIADTTFSTPLSLRVGSGNPTTTVTASDTLATLPGVYVTSPNFEHIWKSGTFEWRRDSIDGAKKAIEDAKLAASNSAAAAAASEQAATSAASNAGSAAMADVEQRVASGEFALTATTAPTFADNMRPLGDSLGFVKLASNPVLTTADTDLPSIYWPWVLKVDGLIATPLGKYYMWFSTDHAQTNGRIALAYTNDLTTGQWTYHGQVYQDTTSGNETETPSVIWISALNLFFMYYQQGQVTGALGSQTTLYATSPDGINWTRGGIALDISAITAYQPNAHTGYFRPHRTGSGYYAYSLLNGGPGSPYFSLSYSRDGRTYRLDPRPLGFGREYLPVEERIEWNTSNVIRWQGENFWIGMISSFASAAETRLGYFAMAPLSADFRSMSGPFVKLFDVTQAWETTYMQQCHAFVDDRKLWVFYRSGDGTVQKPFGFGAGYMEVAL